ncbi:MAG: site-specific tyrosine recombinase/integron integrase [Patescibacteria group bacterium]
MSSEIEKLKQQFLEYLEIEKGSSIKTIENYGHYLTRFFEHTKVKNAKDINDSVVREFRLWLNRQNAHVGTKMRIEKTISKKTQNYYMIALRMFLKFLARRDIASMHADKIELAKVGERAIDLITASELSRLLSAPLLRQDSLGQAKSSDLKSLRDKAILELLFSTGLRVSELCSLTNDLDLTADEFSVRGKGGKVRVVFISEDARTALRIYMKARKDMNEALFVQVGKELKDETPEPLTRRSIARIVKTYATIAGISKKVTPHVIRHCFATDLLSNGADIRSVQVMLGHSNIATTQIYTHVTDSHLRDIHKKFHSKR